MNFRSSRRKNSEARDLSPFSGDSVTENPPVSPISKPRRFSATTEFAEDGRSHLLVRERRQSCMVVHNLLLPGQNDKDASLDDIHSALTTPMQTIANGDAEPLDSDSLSSLVVSVRDLSNSLMSFSMKLRMRNVLVISKVVDSSVIGITRDLATWLLTQHSSWGYLNVYVQDILETNPHFDYSGLKNQPTEGIDRLKFWTLQMCAEHPNLFDFVITLGGDGTVLYTSWLFQKVVPPVLSFSLGSLGFLTNFDYCLKEQIVNDILVNGVTCSLRMRFECTVMKAKNRENKTEVDLENEIESAKEDGVFKTHTVSGSYCILNDLVVDRGPNPTMTTTELYGNFTLLTSIEADGCVISTPSGSTAYSLSAGGSLVHPDIPGILISPICPHTLSFRPLVVPDSVIIRIGVPYDARVSAWCSFDGRSRVELEQGDFLTVVASRFPFPKVQNGKGTELWFKSLSKTLHWNERKRQKAYK